MHKIPVSEIILIFAAIGDRDGERFKTLESDFVSQYSVEIWQDVFNFQVKSALDPESDQWLLNQWLATGVAWSKEVEGLNVFNT